MSQTLEQILWTITQTFYASYCLFQEQYRDYDFKIKRICEEKKVTREKLAKILTMEESRSLLQWNLVDILLEEYLAVLQKLCLKLNKESPFKNLFYYIGDIFCELSLLKSESYKLKLGMPDKRADCNLEELHLFFPCRMLNLSNLFDKAREELEAIASHYRDSKIFLRSLFLFGEETIGKAYPGGLTDFLRKIYPDFELGEFYSKAALSFYYSGFYETALKAAEKAEGFFSKNRHCPIPKEWNTIFSSLTFRHNRNPVQS